MSDQDTVDRLSLREAAALPLYFIVGLLALPFLLLGRVIAIFNRPPVVEYGGLAAPDQRHRATLRTLTEQETNGRLSEVEEMVNELLEDGDWFSLAELVDEWDETGAYVQGAAPLSVLTIEKATWFLSEGYYEANYCTPVNIPIIPTGAIVLIQSLVKQYEGTRFLPCLLSHLHLMQGWGHRGTGAADDVTDAGWTAAHESEAKSRRAVRQFVHADVTSAMLGMLRIGWFAYEMESEAEFTRAFDTYRAADPVSGYGDGWLGYYLLPRWYGSGDFDSDLREFCDRHGAFGPEIYVHAYLQAMQVEGGLHHGLNGPYFADGIRQIADRLAGNQTELNRLIARVLGIAADPYQPRKGNARAEWDTMIAAITAALSDVLRTHVTGVHPDLFEDPAPLLQLISDTFPDAFARGDHFALDHNGIRTTLVQ